MDYKALIEDGQPLQHHGVKGMKWGKRAARATAWGKEFGRAYANAYIHPTHMIAAGNKLAFKNGKNGALKYSVLQGSTNALGYKNKVVKDRLEAKKQYREDTKAAKSKYTLNKNKSAYKAAQLINKTRYKKRLKEAGGDFADYVKQQKKNAR